MQLMMASSVATVDAAGRAAGAAGGVTVDAADDAAAFNGSCVH